MTRVLVAYATKHNSTAEIAGVIGEEILDAGNIQVDVRDVDDIDDISPYDAVILGSAVYAGQWQSSATDFLKEHEQELAQRPVWLFSSGPTGEGDPVTLTKGWEFPQSLAPTLNQIKPQDIVLFHGNLDTGSLNFFERSVVKMVKAPTGDFRDWEKIQNWAASIAKKLLPDPVNEPEYTEE